LLVPSRPFWPLEHIVLIYHISILACCTVCVS